ncbi:MAG: outer membrane beta-barrel protein [Tannerella sp.]|jgi:hypothetical protein|nr:outer membrane beta-barrel protein [Tannerella sp.]
MGRVGLKIIIIAISLFVMSGIYAQHSVSGRIAVIEDGKKMYLEAVNISLSTLDSVFVTGGVSDQKGVFLLKNVASGDYQVTLSYLGYTPQVVSLNGLSKSISLEDVFMEEETTQLETVTVTASNVSNRVDRLIVFVTEQQKAGSSNGINLLNTLQLPRLTVNPVTNQVSLPGDETLQFCINGIKVNSADVRALQPGEVIRVEYLDNPGLRYGKVNVVINYVVRREVSGGFVSLDLSNAVTTSFGDDQIAAKFNYKKSEFGLKYAVSYRNPTKIWTDEERIFHFSDGSSLTRYSDGLPGKQSENYHNMSFNYNLFEERKHYFNVTLRYSFSEDDGRGYSTQYTSLNAADITNTYQGRSSIRHLPSLDLYYMRSLKNKQNIVLNVVGTYIRSDIDQLYEEKKEEEILSDIVSDVAGNKYSIIGEGIYEKTFDNTNRFTAGIKHTQAFANNDYSGTVNTRTKMNQTDSYVYAEYSGKKDKFSYTGGIGLSLWWSKQQGEKDDSFYTFRPKMTLQYNFSSGTFVRLRGEIFNTAPSLSNLSAVDQYIDTLQIMRGNPALRPNMYYSPSVLFSGKNGIYSVNFYNSYLYSPKPVLREVLRENHIFIHTYDNHKDWQKLNSELTLSAGPVKEILIVSLTGGVNYFISNGNTYHHTYTNFYYRAQVMAMYKKFAGVFQANSAYDHFAGESLYGGESSYLFMLNYNAGKFTAGAGILYPFSDQYKRIEESRNVYTPMKETMYANDFSRMVLLKFAWNFDYGRKAKSGTKRTNNTDNDSGIMTGN